MEWAAGRALVGAIVALLATAGQAEAQQARRGAQVPTPGRPAARPAPPTVAGLLAKGQIEDAFNACAGLAQAADPGLARLAERAARETEGIADPGERAVDIRRRIGPLIEASLVRLVAEAGRALPARDRRTYAVHRLVVSHGWSPMLERARAEAKGAEAAEAGLRVEIGRLRSALGAAGADRNILPWMDLALATFQWERQRLGALEATLAGLEKVRAQQGDGAPPFFLANERSLVGLAAGELRQYDKARSAHEQALALCRTYGLPQEAGVLNNLGTLLLRLGDYRAARERLQRAAELFAQDPTQQGDGSRPSVLTNLAKTYEAADDLETAAGLHRQALELARAGQLAAPATVCLCLNNLGLNRYAAGALDEAGRHFDEARRIAEGLYGAGHLRLAEIDANRGWLALARGRLDEAEGLFRGALETTAALGDGHPRRAEFRSALARVLARAGRKEEARGLLDGALAAQEAHLARVLRLALSERDRLALVQELRAHPESRSWPGVLDVYLGLAPELEVPVPAQYARVLAWKGLLARSAPPRAADLAADPEARALAARREQALDRLRLAAHEGADGTSTDAATLAELERQADALERQLRARRPRDDGPAPADATGPDAVRAALPAGSALLDVIEVQQTALPADGQPARPGRRSIAFLIRPDRPPSRVEFGDAAELDRAIARGTRALSTGDEGWREPVARLGALVREPIAPQLDGVTLLLVAGDGRFHQLPLAALPGARPGSFWVEEMAFASVPTAQAVVARRGPGARSAGALAVGGVDYGALKGEWPPLEGTRAEAEAFAAAYRARFPAAPVDLLVGGSAGEPRLRALLPARRVAHLATHGFFRGGRRPADAFEAFGLLAQLDSGLVLAREPGAVKGAENDQYLTAEEVGRLDLRGLDLIVLSSCSSGLGHVSAGQGVVGLLGALDRAGAGTVVCSLWPVTDKPTAALMAAFYRELWGGEGPATPAAALRAAQLGMIRAAGEDPASAHPQNWAAFVVGRYALPPPPEPSGGEAAAPAPPR